MSDASKRKSAVFGEDVVWRGTGLVRRDKSPRMFSDEALRDVLNIEKQAQQIIADAEMQAKQIIAMARQQAQQAIAQAEEDMRRYTETMLNESSSAIQAEIQAIQSQAEQDVEAWAQAARARLPKAVNYVLDIVSLRKTDES